jgi:F-type H+-transporting ATPase subunit delta
VHIGNTLLKRYVGALFAAARENDQIDPIYDALENLHREFQELPDLEHYIISPEVPSSRKLEVLLTAVGPDAPDSLKRFFQIVIQKNREEILPWIFQSFQHFREENLGQVPVEVTTAVDVSPDIKDEITRFLHRLTPKIPVVKWNIDPDLLGGYRILIENRCYDYSLHRQLTNLREQMAG